MPQYIYEDKLTTTGIMDTMLLDIANVFLFASGFLMLYTAYMIKCPTVTI
jgi:hypothetical protein